VTRYTDISPNGSVAKGPRLPVINWESIDQTAPLPLPIGRRAPADPLPAADIVIVTWTSAEWSALDYVFSGSSIDPVSGGSVLNNGRSIDDWSWKQAWFPYSRQAAGFTADPKSGALWGSFRLVEIKDRSQRPWRVLLFKSSSHLAHPPWIDGLSAMTRVILADTGADRIYSIGTAGGGRLGVRLGDVVVTNAALLSLQRPQNTNDPDNGAMFRCQTWFPATALIAEVENTLLYRLSNLVTSEALKDLFAQLLVRAAGTPGPLSVTLEDLLNEPIRPDELGTPRIHVMKDIPLLTTDYYFIGCDNDAIAFSFLEMDDAVIAREAGRLGVRYVFIRNISDPIVNNRAPGGQLLSDAVRSDWSALIYEQFGFVTSFNGALATWATIASEGTPIYDPERVRSIVPTPDSESDPLEVKLVRQVRSCGTCEFFWPDDMRHQPYGPYTAFDLALNTPYAVPAANGKDARRWLLGRTRAPSFPDPEVADGCRKAPIMTIGINPNLTAFLPSQRGAAWAYPSFSDSAGTDAWTKYAWYYRYRSVYQERFTLDFVRKFILSEGRVYAPRSGRLVAAQRPDDSPQWTITVRYDGDATDTLFTLPGQVGEFPFVVLFDLFPPNNAFAAGEVIAGRVAVPEGLQMEVLQEPQGYYTQFLPALHRFQDTLRAAGHTSANLQIGEDVTQLDMVACASPHWKPEFLGGTPQSVVEIVDNCVGRNAWAIKQLIQTRPAVLFVVSQSSWNMLRQFFGAHVVRAQPLPDRPEDHDFTLLRLTTDPMQPCNLVFDVEIDGLHYQHTTRLVITPHFSYGTNFNPQYRLSPTEWASFNASQPDCIAALTEDNGFSLILPDEDQPQAYTVVQLSSDPDKAAAARSWLEQQFPAAAAALRPSYYDANAMMASVLDDLYRQGKLSWTENADGTSYLSRTEGSCQFCVNRHWQFPNECRYGKTKETPPPPDFLERVAAKIVATGKPAPVTPPSIMTTTTAPGAVSPLPEPFQATGATSSASSAQNVEAQT
jgi:nucleoside phosphorylase